MVGSLNFSSRRLHAVALAIVLEQRSATGAGSIMLVVFLSASPEVLVCYRFVTTHMMHRASGTVHQTYASLLGWTGSAKAFVWMLTNAS